MAPISRFDPAATSDGVRPAQFVAHIVGILFSDGNGVRLCEAIGESFPVQCLGDQVSITDLELFPETPDR